MFIVELKNNAITLCGNNNTVFAKVTNPAVNVIQFHLLEQYFSER